MVGSSFCFTNTHLHKFARDLYITARYEFNTIEKIKELCRKRKKKMPFSSHLERKDWISQRSPQEPRIHVKIK